MVVRKSMVDRGGARRAVASEMELAALRAENRALRQQVADLRAGIAAHEQAEKAVWESEEYYRTLVENAGDAIMTCTLDGTITRINRGVEELLGWSRDEVIGQPYSTLVTPASLAVGQERTRRALAGEKLSPVFEAEMICKDGRVIVTEIRDRFIRPPEGHPIGFQVVCRDITARKRAEEALRKSEKFNASLIGQSPLGIVTYTPDGNVTSVNHAWEKIWGVTWEQVKGYNFWTDPQLFTTPLREALGRLMQQGGEIPAFELEYDLGTTVPGGNRRCVSCKFYAVQEENDKVTTLVCLNEDITVRKQMEEALRESEDRYRSLFENAYDGIACLTADGIITSVNRGLEAMLGWSREEMIGQSYEKFHTPASLIGEASRLRRFRAGEKISSIAEVELVHKDGKVVPVEARTRFIRSPNGQPIGVLAILRDSTERKRMEEVLRRSEARLRRIVRATHDAVWEWNLVTNTLWWGEGVQTLFGYAIEEIVPDITWWERHIHPEDRTRVMAKVHTTLATGGRSWSEEYRFRKTDGSYAYVFDRGYVEFDAGGKPLRAFGGMMDITARKRAEEELQKAKETAEAANRAKSEFLATMSHELRTPLGIILGYTELLLEDTFGQLEEAQANSLRRIDRSAQELLDLITAVLDLSRLEAGRLPLALRETPVAGLLQEIRAETQMLQEQTRLAFVWEVEQSLPVLCTDPGKLKIVLKNLIGNAVKFTSQGSITVAARRCRDGVEFRVADTGVGIPQEALELIFEPFRQIEHSPPHQYGGTGLGLHIVKRLLDLLGGTVTVESVVGDGTTFRVWVPLRPDVDCRHF